MKRINLWGITTNEINKKCYFNWQSKVYPNNVTPNNWDPFIANFYEDYRWKDIWNIIKSVSQNVNNNK